jgi:pimeloyl-ACP methyl ester carboxylesterase
MRSVKPDLDVVEAPNIGHAPQLDEPEVWDALVSFLARVP